MQTTTLIAILTLICLVLVVYHHVGYPWLLARWPARDTRTPGLFARRGYVARPGDLLLPTVTVIVPAHDEQTLIAEKVRNLAALDYPPSWLKVVIACDGCSDATAARARAAHAEPECRHLDLEVREFSVNRGVECGHAGVAWGSVHSRTRGCA